MERLLIIGLGGGIGAILRFLLSSSIQERLNNASFPFGTLVVNITGCLLMGWLSYLSGVRGIIDGEWRAFLFIGLLGGFTTFSTFSNETMNLLRGGEYLHGFVTVGMHVFIGVSAAIAGRWIAQSVWR